jgi:hypothetical protein
MIRAASLAGCAFCCTLLLSGAAFGFCRTTTCDPRKDVCETDRDLCFTTGFPLAWRSSCVTVVIHELGAPNSGLSFDDIAPVVSQAFDTWMQADCGSGQPSIEVQLMGSVACGISEYNQRKGNANIVLTREDEWPHIGASNAIAMTTTRFDTETGDLWDADVELNGLAGSLSVGDPVQGDDLLSVLTHEAGHFLGLSHSSDPTATMKPVYDSSTDGIDFRSLEQDDIDGICTIYPPGREPATTSCENRHGFSEDCAVDQPERDETDGGCTCAARPGRVSWSGHVVASLLLVGLLARAKRGDRVRPLVK